MLCVLRGNDELDYDCRVVVFAYIPVLLPVTPLALVALLLLPLVELLLLLLLVLIVFLCRRVVLGASVCSSDCCASVHARQTLYI